jgi:hypothetical protein
MSSLTKVNSDAANDIQKPFPMLNALSSLGTSLVNSSDGNLSIRQNGFTIIGRCTINPTSKAILIATSGKEILGLSTISSVNNGAVIKNNNSKISVEFSIILSYKKLSKRVNGNTQFTLYNGKRTTLLKVANHTLILNSLANNSEIETIAPSYGFYGGGKKERLSIPIKQRIHSLKLQIDEKSGFLNLNRFILLDDNDNIIKNTSNIRVSCSSVYNSGDDPISLFKGKGFHSKQENRPWYEIRFENPTFIKRIEINNRIDKWGIRSKKLQVSVLDDKGNNKSVYNPHDKLAIAHFLVDASKLIKFSNFQISNNDKRRRAILFSLLKATRKNKINKNFLHLLLQFLSVWANEKSSPELLQIEMKILAFYIFESTKRNLSFELVVFSKVLAQASNVEILEKEINSLRAKNKLEHIKLTKHGIAPAGILSQNVPKVLRTIRVVIDDLTSMGLKPCLAYGTLLGAVREKQFIEHDDDVDLLIEFPLPTATYSEVFTQKENLMSQFDTEKYKVTTEQSTVIHLTLRETNIMIDIFPYWEASGLTQLHMEKMNIRGISTTILSTRSTVELHGEQFPSPGESEEFLRERYGDAWKISDKYHEWRWPIETAKTELITK